jgi:hypothetical protein
VKSYPSIPGSIGQDFRAIPGAYIFDKLDGSQVRAEWTKKAGWAKFGTKKRLLDTTDEHLGEAVTVFRATMEEGLTRLARDNRWRHLVVFMELHGPGSFAGQHVEGEEKTLTLFDLCPDKRGVLGPRQFLRLTRKLKVPVVELLDQRNWTQGFVQEVREGNVPGVTFEGVVGKAGDGHKLVMAKAKTQAWIDKVYATFGEGMGNRIVYS